VRIELDHVVIHVSDWERSNRFYRDVLGAELIDKGDGGPSRHYRFGDTQLNVHGPGMHPHPVARMPVEPGNSDLCFVWDGPIVAAVDHLTRHDVEVEDGPVERHGARGAGTSVYFRDPDGSLLELISYT
jgi:catechol 2,3-dioxygenase-like lactoylglutathione lyase family enzyme